jgi:outer membrane protein assembly factor BamB
MPAADPASSGLGISEVAASAAPNPAWLSERGTPALSSIKGTADIGTPAASGPSANQGQTISLKGAAVAPGVLSFTGYNGTSVASPLTNIKIGKKAKVTVPPLAITGDAAILPDGGEPSNALRIQIVPTISSLSTKTVTIGGELTINGTGFDPNVRVVLPGVAEPLVPATFDNDTAVLTIPAGTQKGKLMIQTPGGSSNTMKIKIASASVLANRLLATDPQTGRILATDDVANTLTAYDPASGAVVWTANVGFEPEGLAVTPSTREAVVIADGSVPVTVDLDTGATRPGWSSERPIQNSSVDVEHFSYARELWRIDPRIELVTASRASRVVAVDGDLGLLYVVDLETLEPVSVHRFDGPVEGIAIGLDGRAYTIDRATGQLLSVPVD